MTDKTTDARETCQLGDLPTGTRFLRGDDEFMMTDAHCDLEGYSRVVNLANGAMHTMNNSLRLALTRNRRLRVWE